MKTLYLHGYAAKFGESFEMDVKDPAEFFRALCLQIPGFEEMMREGEWHVLRGPVEQNNDDTGETLHLALGTETEFHLIPAVRGAGGGNGGMLSIIIGIVAIIAAPFTGGASMAMYFAGAGMIVGGIIQMTMKIPGADTNTESEDNKASFLFAGPKNQSTQGVAIPRGYGRCRCGSIVISAGLYAERLAV